MSDSAATPAPADTLPVLGSVDDYLRFCMEYDASDLHLATGSQPTWRRFGNLQPIWNNAAILTAEDARRLAYGFLNEKQAKDLEEKGVFLIKGAIDYVANSLQVSRYTIYNYLDGIREGK